MNKKNTFIDNESSNNYGVFNAKYQEIRMQWTIKLKSP